MKCIHKRGSVAEGVLALKGLSVFAFSIGTDCNSLFLDQKEKLKALITDR